MPRSVAYVYILIHKKDQVLPETLFLRNNASNHFLQLLGEKQSTYTCQRLGGPATGEHMDGSSFFFHYKKEIVYIYNKYTHIYTSTIKNKVKSAKL